jgi:hypothetical protein
MLKISNTLLAVSQLMNEKSAKMAQKFMANLDYRVYRSVARPVSIVTRELNLGISGQGHCDLSYLKFHRTECSRIRKLSLPSKVLRLK